MQIISIDPKTYFLWAAMLLLVPLNWMTAAFLAAAFHELGHISMILILGGKVRSMEFYSGGAVIHTDILALRTELLCALAGPVSSFFLALLCEYLPRTAICAVLQGLFNLIPVYPLDGGRALRCALELWMPRKAVRVEQIIKWAILTYIGLSAIWLALWFRIPAALFLPVWILGVDRKKPCKPLRFAVQ